MLAMKNLRVATKLHLIVVMSAMGLAVFGGLAYLAIDKIKVGGPVHQEMVLYSDLAGDILPPTLDVERVRASVQVAAKAESLPAQIAIFRGPILRLCETRGEAVREIRDTVVHEVGHALGLEDEEMPY